MRKSKGVEQQHQLASGCILWICKHGVPGLNPALDIVIFWVAMFVLENYLSLKLILHPSTGGNNQAVALAIGRGKGARG